MGDNRMGCSEWSANLYPETFYLKYGMGIDICQEFLEMSGISMNFRNKNGISLISK
jgi:hypothetical protein